MPLRTILITATRSGTASTVIIRRGASGAGTGGTGDHGALTGLGDDDHTQYHNDTRGDARYQAKSATLTATTASFTTAQESKLALITGTNTGDQDLSGLVPLNGNAGTPSAIVLTNATGNATALSVNFAVTSLYANDAGMAGGVARSGIITALLSDPLPITSGGTGQASESTARTALKVPGSVITGISGATAISNIVSISLANYNLIGTKDPTTLYVIA